MHPWYRVRCDHGERVEGVLEAADGRPGPVPGRRHHPEDVLAPAYLRADLVRRGRRAPDVDVAQPDQPAGVVQQRLDDEAGLVEGLDPDRGLEEHGETAGVLTTPRDRPGR